MSQLRVRVLWLFVTGLVFLQTSKAIFKVPDLHPSSTQETKIFWLRIIRYVDVCNDMLYSFSRTVRAQAEANCEKGAQLLRNLPSSTIGINCHPTASACIKSSLFGGRYCTFTCSGTSGSYQKALRKLVEPKPIRRNKTAAYSTAATYDTKRGIKVHESLYPSSP
nr:PREDICTED: uncharacterized protein LOC109031762 [Bemisia tabaci]